MKNGVLFAGWQISLAGVLRPASSLDLIYDKRTWDLSLADQLKLIDKLAFVSFVHIQSYIFMCSLNKT